MPNNLSPKSAGTDAPVTGTPEAVLAEAEAAFANARNDSAVTIAELMRLGKAVEVARAAVNAANAARYAAEIDIATKRIQAAISAAVKAEGVFVGAGISTVVARASGIGTDAFTVEVGSRGLSPANGRTRVSRRYRTPTGDMTPAEMHTAYRDSYTDAENAQIAEHPNYRGHVTERVAARLGFAIVTE